MNAIQIMVLIALIAGGLYMGAKIIQMCITDDGDFEYEN